MGFLPRKFIAIHWEHDGGNSITSPSIRLPGPIQLSHSIWFQPTSLSRLWDSIHQTKRRLAIKSREFPQLQDMGSKLCDPLQWRHNGRDSVSNHQSHDCLLNRLFRRRSKKTSKLRVTGLCAGNSLGTGELLFPFDDVIMHYKIREIWQCCRGPVKFVNNTIILTQNLKA